MFSFFLFALLQARPRLPKSHWVSLRSPLSSSWVGPTEQTTIVRKKGYFKNNKKPNTIQHEIQSGKNVTAGEKRQSGVDHPKEISEILTIFRAFSKSAIVMLNGASSSFVKASNRTKTKQSVEEIQPQYGTKKKKEYLWILVCDLSYFLFRDSRGRLLAVAGSERYSSIAK